MDHGIKQVQIKKPDTNEKKSFTFDFVYDDSSTQQQVYDDSAFSLVESVLEGYNGTMFAYGQTGCGKTHTMVGSPESEETKGIIPKAFKHIFGCIDGESGSKKFLVRCSYLEIYNEAVIDLLGKDRDQKLVIK